MADYVDNLSDAELRTKLAEYGFPVVPITATTRKVMVKKLKLLIENKSKANVDGRRSLGRYSSEEESDTDSKSKQKNRRATVGTTMQPPATNKLKKNSRVETKDVGVPLRSPVKEEIVTKRTTTTFHSVQETEFDTGSDSEPEIVDVPSKPLSSSSPNSSFKTNVSKPRSSLGLGGYGADAAIKTQSYSSPKPYVSPYQSRFSSVDSYDSGDAQDRLNQIRARLNLSSTVPDKPLFSTYERKSVGGVNDYGDGNTETPFLSNFTRRLSQLSSSGSTASPKPSYDYKSDIKEHDSNGSSYTRSYLTRPRSRDILRDFRSSQEKNVFKNNLVSFTLLGIVVLFFLVIGVMYVGIRSEQQSSLADSSDNVIPVCKSPPEGNTKPGINCIMQNESTGALNLLKVILPQLKKRAYAHHCVDSSKPYYMTDEQIIRFVQTQDGQREAFAIRKDIHNLQVLILRNPKWEVSILEVGGSSGEVNALQSIDDILLNRHNANIALGILYPDLPWKCILYNKLYAAFIPLFVVAVGFSILYTSRKVYNYIEKGRKNKSDQIYSMVERIIDILQSNAADNGENFLAVNHVRDMIISPYERSKMSAIWDGAVRFLEENESRVRSEVQIVSGEEFQVWRWLGNPNLTPRSKSWQGQAFETKGGSVNSLPCSPTPCLKIRGMFDERERNLTAIQEAVLNKCASECKVLHCAADTTTSCVYLKCATQADAAVAYRNLHGWWYDGHLVTLKYLRLERYMQRFPDSPARGPPYLQPSAPAQSTGNDWSNDN